MKVYGANLAAASNVPAQSCADVKITVSGLTGSDEITGFKPPRALGNLSLNGYASAADTVILHFCNPTSSSAAVPTGLYSFLAVR
jgi:hypothetical protein